MMILSNTAATAAASLALVGTRVDQGTQAMAYLPTLVETGKGRQVFGAHASFGTASIGDTAWFCNQITAKKHHSQQRERST